MIETSSQKNYLVLIQNFGIKIMGDSHGNFLSISLYNSLLQFGAFPVQLSKWCLCAFQWGYLNYTIFSFFICLLLCTFGAKPPEPNLHQPSDLWSILKQRHPARLNVPHKIPLHIFSNHMLNAQWLMTLTLRLPHHAKEGLQSSFLVFLSTAPCLSSSAAWFSDPQK